MWHKAYVEFLRAKKNLQEIQEKISDLKIEEKEAKKEFLKSLELEEDFYTFEGDIFTVVGIQFQPEPIAIVHYHSGSIAEQSLNWIKEQFITWEEMKGINHCDTCQKEIAEGEALCVECKEELNKEIAQNHCSNCKKEIPAGTELCIECDLTFCANGTYPDDVYPCSMCEKMIPITEPCCEDCKNKAMAA